MDKKYQNRQGHDLFFCSFQGEKHKFFKKNTNFYLQHLNVKDESKNIYVLFPTLKKYL